MQLVDASTGAHLWAETYDRPFRPEAVFALQDDLVPRIVSTVADAYGVLPHSMSGRLRGRAPNQLTPYEAVIRSFGYYERITAEEHAEVRACLEYAVERAPGNADCWAMLALIYVHEFNSGFNVRPDPLGRTVGAAQRAVASGPPIISLITPWPGRCTSERNSRPRDMRQKKPCRSTRWTRAPARAWVS